MADVFKRPRTRRVFPNDVTELNYLNDQIAYSLYTRRDRARAQKYAVRLGELLEKEGPEDGSIMRHEFWSVFYEAKGDLPKAIAHRELEVLLIRRVFSVPDPILDYPWLALTLVLLARLYRQVPWHEAADANQDEARRLAKKYKFVLPSFDR